MIKLTARMSRLENEENENMQHITDSEMFPVKVTSKACCVHGAVLYVLQNVNELSYIIHHQTQSAVMQH